MEPCIRSMSAISFAAHRDAPSSMSELRLALLFKLQLCRFIPNLHHTEIERIASFLCAPPIPIHRPMLPPQPLSLDTQQVRGLLDAAAAIYCYEKAKLTAAAMVNDRDGSGSIRQSSSSCSCNCCKDLLQRSSASTSLSPADMARSHMHQRIDDSPFIKMKLITEEIIPLNPSWSHGQFANDIGPPQEEVEAVRLLLHRLVDIVNYEMKDAEEEGQCYKESALTFESAPSSSSSDSLQLTEPSELGKQILSELWRHMHSEEELREWMCTSTEVSVDQYCVRSVVKGMRLDALIWMLLIKIQPYNLYDSFVKMSTRLQLLSQAMIEDCRRWSLQSHGMIQHLDSGKEHFDRVVDVCFTRKARMGIEEQRQHDREAFVRRSNLTPPTVLRFIDLEATSRDGQVCLVGYDEADRSAGFTAVSHTFGNDVYETFNCHCASKWVSGSSNSTSTPPRWKLGERCPHEDAEPTSYVKQRRDRVVDDILGMCHILHDSGARYVWHDGVCIAQHDEEEVKATIERVGWVYAYATDTTIFLHYVGNPISVVTMMEGPWERFDLRPRWHERAWTYQEAVLSKKRRYCVRIPPSALQELSRCSNLEDFEQMVERWYGSSNAIQVVDEDTMVDILFRVSSALRDHFSVFLTELQDLVAIWRPLLASRGQKVRDESVLPNLMETLELLYPKICLAIKASKQLVGIDFLNGRIPFDIPTPSQALRVVCERDVKHEGDRMNGILTICEVGNGFVAPKDDDIERSTIEFFRSWGDPQNGLQTALYAINFRKTDDVPGKRWVPCLRNDLILLENFSEIPEKQTHLSYDVVGTELHLRVVGKMLCCKVEFEVQNTALPHEDVDDRSSTVGVDHQNNDALQKFRDCGTRLISTYVKPRSVVVDPATVAEAEKEYDDALEHYVTVTSSAASATPTGLLWEEYIKVYRTYYARSLDAMLVYKTIFRERAGILERALQPVEVVNAIEREQETEIVVKLRHYTHGQEYFEAMGPGALRCSFGLMASPYVYQRKGMRFSACLMWPRAAAEAEGEGDGASWPMLVVEGDPKGSNVEKIGVLIPTPLFRACVRRWMKTSPSTDGDVVVQYLDSLIIN